MANDLFETETRDVTIPEIKGQSSEDSMLERIAALGNIEVLERFLAARKSEQERAARIAFEVAFVKMHSEFPTIPKSRKSHTGKYAAIEDIQKAINPIVKKYGFAYWWESEKIEGGILEYIVISYNGYSKRSPCYIPFVPTNNATNPAQAIGSMQSYGRRYSLIDGFGLTTTGDDDDGNMGAIDKEAEPFIEQIKKCETREALGQVYIHAIDMNKNNKAVCGLLALAKDEKLRELKNGAA